MSASIAHPQAGPSLVTRVVGAVRSELVLARIGIGAVALHVVDDSFLQPQPGTFARDHLISGLVPLALLVLAAWVYPRLRAGARASLALGVGFIGASLSSEAVLAVRDGGPSGDDYSGFGALGASLLLLSIGASTLWTSRRVDDGRTWRYLRRALIAIGAAVVVLQVAVPTGFAYLITHAAGSSVATAELGTPYEHVSFTTSDGLRIAGWYIPSQNRAAVIAFPGRDITQPHARMLARHGYGVLLFDPRGEGASEGDPNGLGWAGDRDLKAALAFLAARPDVDGDRLGGIGLSVGGELLLETAAESSALKAVVSEGAGMRSSREGNKVAKWHELPELAVLTGATALFSNHTPPPYLGDLVGRIAPRSVFFIHATHGRGGEQLNPSYYQAAGQPKQLWAIPDAGHMEGIKAHPKEYERRVVAFFDRALLEPR